MPCQPERSHSAQGGALRRVTARLAAGVLLAALGLGAPDVLGQQAQEAPAGQAPQQQETPQQAPAPEGAAPPDVEMTERRFQDWMLLIRLPLGILLPAGVTMQIDSGAAIPLEVERCERQGCRIERLIEPDLMSRLKAGTKATVFFEAFDPQGKRQRLGVPISLLGFTAALNEVTS